MNRSVTAVNPYPVQIEIVADLQISFDQLKDLMRLLRTALERRLTDDYEVADHSLTEVHVRPQDGTFFL